MHDFALWAIGFASGVVFGVLLEWVLQPKSAPRVNTEGD